MRRDTESIRTAPSAAARAFVVLALAAVALGCRTGPDPVCVSGCERDNDMCMMQAATPSAIQGCDDGVGACLRTCR
ncbi:MAG: hypothetical protein AB7S26_24795 [Sandaracinaceae bacterium]